MKIDSGLSGVMPSNKPHGKKKKEKKPTNNSKGNKNNKAFNVANIVSTKRNMQRNLDKAQQKEVVPLTNREEAVPPPVMVAVMGPKGVGKSTLIRSLVKIYTGQNITDTTGPITVVANSKKRFTFFECPLDLFSMTDTAKIADLVLLLIDGSYGFEMETFEFLNILQLHGFPKVMGVLTHLDTFKSVKGLQNTKKQIKHRFWTEIYKGAKLFDFMGVVNGKYRKHEVKRMSLHLNRVKFRPLVWKNTHSYMLIDRVEDVTQSNKRDDDDEERLAGEKDVTLFGYVRGTHLKLSSKVHLLGVGDFPIHNMTILPDPCPVKGSKDASLENGEKKAILNRKKQKETLLYAPMANVGRVSMDKDALYIELKNVHYTKKDQLYVPDQQKYGSMTASDGLTGAEDEEGEDTVTPMGLLRSMQSVKVGVDEQLLKNKRSLSLFANSNNENDAEGDEYDNDDYDDENEDEEDDDVDDEDDDDEQGDNEDEDNEEEEEEEEEDDEDDNEDYDEDEVEQAEELDDLPSYGNGESKGSKLPASRAGVPVAVKDDIMKLVYGDDWAANTSSKSQSKQTKLSQKARNDDSDEDDDFFAIKKPTFASKGNLGGAYSRVWQDINRIDSSRFGLKQFLFSNGTSFNTGPTTNYLKAVSHASNTSSKKTASSGSSVGYALLRTRFVTGGFKNPIKANDATGTDEEEGDVGSDEEGYGDFEDLEATNDTGNNNKKSQRRSDSDDEEDESEDEMDEEEAQELENEKIDEELRKMNAQKKSLFKMKFDSQYDKKKQGEGSDEEGGNDDDGSEDGGKKKGKKGRGKRGEEEEEEEDDSQDILKQAQEQQAALALRTKEEFADVNDVAKLQYVGAAAGKYVRIHLRNVPAEFLDCFSSKRPVIIGGLSGNEAGVGYVTARVKRHRWHRRVLKSQDPIIVSLGWRRYQSIPVYSTTDANDRHRYLKYTPEHMHCMVTFYGPLVAPNTGILAYQVVHNTTTNFRIALTGTTLETSATPDVVKKLKLVGTPVKIYKNTAYITGMFTSNLEVAKFEHAKIKTVSGIRGTIKKALTERNDAEMIGGKGKHEKGAGGYAPGTFRATFEDKILISDIIICRLWVPVAMKAFYNPVLSLLAAPDTVAQSSDGTGQSLTGKSEAGAGGVVLMRTTAQLRKDFQVAQQVNKDSVYKQITRTQRDFGKVKVPAKLQAALPYASKPKLPKAKNPENYLNRRAVVLEPEEKKARALVQTLMTIKKDKDAKRKEANLKRSQEKQKQAQRETERFKEFHKDEKKRKYKENALADARKKKKMQ